MGARVAFSRLESSACLPRRRLDNSREGRAASPCQQRTQRALYAPSPHSHRRPGEARVVRAPGPVRTLKALVAALGIPDAGCCDPVRHAPLTGPPAPAFPVRTTDAEQAGEREFTPRAGPPAIRPQPPTRYAGLPPRSDIPVTSAAGSLRLASQHQPALVRCSSHWEPSPAERRSPAPADVHPSRGWAGPATLRSSDQPQPRRTHHIFGISRLAARSSRLHLRRSATRLQLYARCVTGTCRKRAKIRYLRLPLVVRYCVLAPQNDGLYAEFCPWPVAPPSNRQGRSGGTTFPPEGRRFRWSSSG